MDRGLCRCAELVGRPGRAPGDVIGDGQQRVDPMPTEHDRAPLRRKLSKDGRQGLGALGRDPAIGFIGDETARLPSPAPPPTQQRVATLARRATRR
jgi:hypothetical protein